MGCSGADAGAYMPGLVTQSKAGTWYATIVSMTTTSVSSPVVDGPAVGLSTFTVTITGVDQDLPAGATLTVEKPYMPFHRHWAATAPKVVVEGAGIFVISNINFFMHGYFEIALNLSFAASVGEEGAGAEAGAGLSADGAAAAAVPAPDKIVLAICVPS